MNKILIICGPTATGKTELALKLAQLIPADLISADSRQIYVGLDIVTGKDIPANFHKQQDCYTDGNTRIFGLDIANVTEGFSVSQWKKYADQKIKEIHDTGRLPIVVGGTGLYIKSLTHSMTTLEIPPNQKLRETLRETSVADLYLQLEKINPQKAHSLNNSDKNNPHRLIRAIEVSHYQKIDPPELKKYNILQIGLTCDMSEASNRIVNRVKKRVASGAIHERETLEKSGYFSAAQNAVEVYKYLQDPPIWIRTELQQFKRQQTWFKNIPDVYWFDVSNHDWQDAAVTNVQQWYSKISPWRDE